MDSLPKETRDEDEPEAVIRPKRLLGALEAREVWGRDAVLHQVRVLGRWVTYRRESPPPFDNGWT